MSINALDAKVLKLNNLSSKVNCLVGPRINFVILLIHFGISVFAQFNKHSVMN